MVFWILVAAMVAAVTLAITRPLTRAPDASGSGAGNAADIAVYKDQLKEIAADAARGSIAAGEAEAARIEVERRLLRSSEPDAKVAPANTAARRAWSWPVYVATSIALPVASLGLYLTFGDPGLPGQPLSERLAEAPAADRPNDLIAKVEQRLREHPEDGNGWDVIAPVYYAIGRFPDASEAYANAMRLIGESPQRLQGFANARIREENGIVTEDARKALERIIVLAPDSKEPRIWLALAKEQDGRLNEAADDYRKLIAEAPDNVPWRRVLEARLANITSGDKPADGGPLPMRPDASAVAKMSPTDRQAFVQRMVDGLAARLKADGSDAAGWVKLIRAYEVLGRRDDAVKALADARLKLKSDVAGLAQVEDLARQLGLGS